MTTLLAIILTMFVMPITIVKGAPPASFIDIDTIPFSRTVTQAEYNVANQIWFRYVATEDIVLGSYTNQGGTFVPKASIYQSDGTTLIKAVSFSVGWWRQLSAGTYYIKITRTFPNEAGASDFDFTTTFETAPVNSTPISTGSYLIPDDNSNNLAGTVYQSDGTLQSFYDTVPTGEIGDSLPNGYSLIHDRFGKYLLRGLTLLDPDLNVITTIPAPWPVTSEWPGIVNDGTSFYAIDRNGGGVYKIDIDGTLTGPLATVPYGGLYPIAHGISRDAENIYWAAYSTGVIKKYNIDTNTTSDLYAIPGFTGSDRIAFTPNFNPGEIIVMPDDSMVTWWRDASETADHVLHIAADGTLIDDIEYDHPIKINHIHYASDSSASDSVSIWFFLDSSSSQGRVSTLTLSTGVLSPSFDTNLFTNGVNLTSDPNELGPSNSCPFVLLGYTVSAPSFDLAVQKIVDDATPDEEDTILYTATITNTGDTATSIEVEDILPAEVTYVSHVASQGTYDDNTGVWLVGDLDDTEFATLAMTVTVNVGTAGDTFDNTATKTTPADTDATNDSATVSVTVNAIAPPPPPPPTTTTGGSTPQTTTTTTIFFPPGNPPPAPAPVAPPPGTTEPPLPQTGLILDVLPWYVSFYFLFLIVQYSWRNIYAVNGKIRMIMINNQMFAYQPVD